MEPVLFLFLDISVTTEEWSEGDHQNVHDKAQETKTLKETQCCLAPGFLSCDGCFTGSS